jgi:hypothetical protein
MNYWQAEIVDDHTIERKKLVSSSIAYFQKQAICTVAFGDWFMMVKTSKSRKSSWNDLLEEERRRCHASTFLTPLLRREDDLITISSISVCWKGKGHEKASSNMR